MTILLLTRGPDPRAIEVRRCHLHSRLLARARSFKLDQALVAGASPDSSATLSLRAQTLISASHRQALARELRALVQDAGRPFHPFDPGIPLSRDVLRAREVIEELALLLESAEALDTRGVAKLQILLRDGNGPLFNANGPPSLRRSLQGVIDAMTLPPPIPADV